MKEKKLIINKDNSELVDIENLSAKLTNEFGSGFSPVSIRRMRRLLAQKNESEEA